MTDWTEHRARSKAKRWENYHASCAILQEKNIRFTIVDPATGHLKVRDRWSFWPTTGKFYNEVTKEKGRGVFELLKLLGYPQQNGA